MTDFWFWMSVTLWFFGGLGMYGAEAKFRGGRQSFLLFIGTLVTWLPLVIAATISGIFKGIRSLNVTSKREGSQ